MADDDLTGQHHCKEVRLRVRCSKCGRVLRSHQSQVRRLCYVCDLDGTANRVWARRIKIKDEVLAAYMNEKLTPKPPSILARLKQMADRQVEVKGADELLALLKKKAL